MNKLKIALIILVLSFTLFHCTNEEENPVPQILSASPTSIIAHLPEFTMTINGQDFIEGSVIIFDGKEKATSFISNSQLSCQISPEDTMMNIVSSTIYTEEIKNMEKPVSIIVRNPAPGGGSSTPVNFTIKENFEFESPRRVFPSIINGWIGPMVIDNEDNLIMNVSKLTFQKYNITLSNHLTISEDQGDTWSEPEEISKVIEQIGDNLFLDDQGNTHTFYNDWDGRIMHLFHKKRMKDGTWQTPSKISIEDKGVNYNFMDHRASVSKNRIVAVWTIITRNYEQYFAFSFSEDYGETWTIPLWMKDLGTVIWADSVITENGDISIAYAEYRQKGRRSYLIDIYTVRSTDNGSTWSEPVMISNGAGRSYLPRILYQGTGNEFSVFWVFQKTGKIFAEFSNNYDMKIKGKIADKLQRTLNNVNNLNTPNDVSSPSFHIRMASSANNGKEWGSEMSVLDFQYKGDFFANYGFNIGTDKAGNLNLLVNDSFILFGVAGESHRDAPETFTSYFMRSIDGGENWTQPVHFSTDPEFVAEYINADSKGNVYILLNKYDFRKYYAVEPFFSKSIK